VIDHLIIEVDDLAASRAFYEQALAPLGCSVVMEFADRCALGPANGRPQFWLAARGRPTTTGVHIAFPAAGQEAVDAFHRAALAAGGTDNGPPGPRPQYHTGYYGAFALDPHGNNVEAVHHGPTSR
jgi:catechol 2,3-dioxygenase-like lactoylglutathione lyase family enzyme